MTDLKAALTDEEAEKMARAHCFANGCASIECNKRGTCACTIHPHEIFAMRTAWLASPGPALRGEGGSSSASLPAAPRAATEGKWVLVPLKATPEMRRAGQSAADDKLWAWKGLGPRPEGTGLDGMTSCVLEAYGAMLAAAPEPPASGWPLGGQDPTPEDASGMPKDFLPADVKAAVERLSVVVPIAVARVTRTLEMGWLDRRYVGHAVGLDNIKVTDIRLLLASHTALTEANERLRAGLEPFAKFRLEGFDGEVLEVVPSDPDNPARRIEPIWTSHFRRARALLAQAIGEGKT